MSGVHIAVGAAVLAANAVAAAWGGAAWARKRTSVWFWYLLRLAQVTVVVEAALGLVLLIEGREADDLHYVYGIAPLVISVFTEAMRIGQAQKEIEAAGGEPDQLDRREQVLLARRIVIREIGVMTMGCILIVTLSLRALQSG